MIYFQIFSIEEVYKGAKSRITTLDGETDLFEITAGIIQKNTLAAYMFVLD